MVSGRTMYFHADASPVGGVLGGQPLGSQASSSISQAGGVAVGGQGCVTLGPGISVGTATSTITGQHSTAAGGWVTDVQSVVTDLNILGKITVGSMIAHLRLVHPDTGENPFVSFCDSGYTDLFVGGVQVHPLVDLDRFARNGVSSTPLSTGWLNDAGMVGQAVSDARALLGLAGLPSWIHDRYAWMTQVTAHDPKGHVLCSLVQDLPGAPSQSYRHVLPVTGLGNLFFGELVVEPGGFGLTMLRVEFEGPTMGQPTMDGPTTDGPPRNEPTPGGSTPGGPAKDGDDNGVLPAGDVMGVASAHSNGRPVP